MENLLVYILFFFVRINLLKVNSFSLDIKPIAPIYWIDNERIFVNEIDTGYVYSIEDREIVKEYEKEENEILGGDSNNMYICSWENRSISTPEEFSTHLKKFDTDRKLLIDIELKQTLEVVECRDSVVLKTVFPIKEVYFVYKDSLYEVEEYTNDYLSPNWRYLLRENSLENLLVYEFQFNQLF